MVASPPATAPDASRARLPDATGEIERDGTRIAWDRYGPADPEPGEPTILLTPTWSIIHSRFWKAQIPYLARHYRVVTWDGRGSGRSDRPATRDAYADDEFAQDGLAVLDATATPTAVVVGLSAGARWTLLLAANHPDRVAGAVFIGASLPVRVPAGGSGTTSAFHDEPASDEGWDLYNAVAWRRDFDRFLRFFFGRCFTEPHSTKQIEDCIGWGHETGPETLILTVGSPGIADRREVESLAARVQCPMLVIHGTEDAVTSFPVGVALADIVRAPLLELRGAGHIPLARDPVKVNLALRAFVESLPPRRP